MASTGLRNENPKVGDKVVFYDFTMLEERVGTVTEIDAVGGYMHRLGVRIDGSLWRPYSYDTDTAAYPGSRDRFRPAPALSSFTAHLADPRSPLGAAVRESGK